MSVMLAELSVAQEAAQQAYDDGEWVEATIRWDAIAKKAIDRHIARHAFFMAACALARQGHRDDAFAKLDDALAAEALVLEELERESALEALRDDERWPALLIRAATLFAAWEATLGNHELRRELMQLRDEDQAVREAGAAFLDVDRRTAARLLEIITDYGWPAISAVGHDGAAAAWLIAQHATHDRAFQERCFAMLRDAAGREEAEPRYVAYLEDRLANTAGRPQRYGTQFDADLQPSPIEDEEHVDERRRLVGLSSMAAYTRLIRKRFGE